MPSTTSSSTDVSVIVTTYNRPEALKAVLVGLNAQTTSDFEVIIADDGSQSNTTQMVQALQNQSGYPLIHVWQEDQGFRAARARNLAVTRSRGSYLIFLDGDCVPPPNFIQGHLKLAEPNWFVRGNRILLSQDFTHQVLAQQLDLSQLTWPQLAKFRLQGRIRRLGPLFKLPLGPMRKMVSRKWQGAKTCNLGIWREDFYRLNGFDESYTGWGHEDADLVVRLLRSGILRKEGNFAIPTFHLWHALNDRSGIKENEARLQHILSSEHIAAASGLNNHRPE